MGTVGALEPGSCVRHCGEVTQPVLASAPHLQSGGLLSGRHEWVLVLGKHRAHNSQRVPILAALVNSQGRRCHGLHARGSVTRLRDRWGHQGLGQAEQPWKLCTPSQRPRECFSERVPTPFPGTGETPSCTDTAPHTQDSAWSPSLFPRRRDGLPTEITEPFLFVS